MLKGQISFRQMWGVISKFHKARSSHFSPEMIACIFWEESGYCNVENKGSHAAGFGQVLPSLIDTVNTKYKTQFSRESVLQSEEQSTEVAILALELAWEWKKAKVEALRGYAGYPLNQEAVRKWLAAEGELLKAKLSTDDAASGDQEQIIAALKLCSQPGWDPAELFK